MSQDMPLLDVLATMTWSSFKECELSPRELMIARLSALAAVGAPPVSYLANTEVAKDAGITLEDVESVLIAVAPIIGTAQTVTASGNIARALGFEISAIEARFEAELSGHND
jgi:alkylhydroperoxidase/carboxymuconolactone decarboxylase family protein YurZ